MKRYRWRDERRPLHDRFVPSAARRVVSSRRQRVRTWNNHPLRRGVSHGPVHNHWSGFILGVIYGSQVHARKFDLRLSLFGLPFLAFSVFFGILTLLAVWGRVVISVNGDEGKLFTGVGSVGKTRKFKWGAIREIHKGTYMSPTQSRYPQVVLEGDSRLSFGAGVQRTRLDFMLEALQLMLYERHQPPETS
jgi:hypothetical protein